MKVSFVVPVYNVEDYVEECIESILKQKGDSFEIILVNDGSSDGSGSICKKYAEKNDNIIYIQQHNQGVSAARNTGLNSCSGEWVFFIDGDDTISQNLLQCCLPFLNSENDICFVKHKEVFSGNKIIESTSLNVKSSSFVKMDFEEFILATFNRDYPGKYDYHNVKMATPCKFYKKKIIEEQEIRFPLGIKTGEDALFNLEFYKHAKKGSYVDEELYYHRVWGNSVSQRYNPNIEIEFAKFHEKIREFINSTENPSKYEEAYLERCIWSIGFCCMLNYCSSNNPQKYGKRKKDFQFDRKKYIHQIKKVSLSNFRFEKKILFFCVKMNWFAIIDLLCKMKRKI